MKKATGRLLRAILFFAGLWIGNVPTLYAQSSPGSIRWRAPGEGLAESRRTHKPILYDMTAAWCGYCHLLERQVFEDPDCAARINRLFIPVRVMDRSREEGANGENIQALETRYQLTGFPTLVVQYPGRRGFHKFAGFGGKTRTMNFLNQAVR